MALAAAVISLKPVQIYGRPLSWAKRRFMRVSDGEGRAREAGQLKTEISSPLPETIELSVLNKAFSMPLKKMRWLNESDEKLRRYHLNYCEFLEDGALPASLKLYLLLDWIEKNPDERAESWEPYVISRRIPHWLAFMERYSAEMEKIPGARRLILSTLFPQLFRLMADLEHHIQGNHLLENLATLVRGSLFFLGRDDFHNPRDRKLLKQLYDVGALGLRRQMREQVLPDGGHYELSPMYHRVMMHAMKSVMESCRSFSGTMAQDLLTVTPQALAERCKEAQEKMEGWLAWFAHPDGGHALFGDSAFNAYPCIRGALPYPSEPGHSHCDALSYELSLAGERVVIDSGCGSYQDSSIRAAW